MVDMKEAELLAIRLAKKAGRLLIRYKNRFKIVEIKDVNDFATDLDFMVEEMLIKAIKKKYPSHSVYSEESKLRRGSSEYTWIIDPIDGTKHFVRGVPLFTVSIALQYKSRLVIGVVFDPNSGNLYHAHTGGGAYRNNKRISVSRNRLAGVSLVYLDTPKWGGLNPVEKSIALHRFESLMNHFYRVRTFGVGSLALCYLAQGAFDAYFDLTGKTKFVDLAAGAVVLKEAGGYIADINGKRISHKNKHYLATNGLLTKSIRRILSSSIRHLK